MIRCCYGDWPAADCTCMLCCSFSLFGTTTTTFYIARAWYQPTGGLHQLDSVQRLGKSAYGCHFSGAAAWAMGAHTSRQEWMCYHRAPWQARMNVRRWLTTVCHTRARTTYTHARPYTVTHLCIQIDVGHCCEGLRLGTGCMCVVLACPWCWHVRGNG